MRGRTNLDLLLQVPLKTTPNNLPLARLKPIHHTRYRPYIIRHREQNQLLIDKVVVRDLVRVVVEERARLELLEPLFTLVRLLLAERELDQLFVAVLGRGEGDHVLLHVAEVVPRVFVFARTETLFASVSTWNTIEARRKALPCSTCSSIGAHRASPPATARTRG